jgi:alkylation response protein AidB-like acyl-CoA dehydrogenase
MSMSSPDIDVALEIDQRVPDDQFRAQVRDWIGRHAPEGLANMVDWSELLVGNWWNFPEERASEQYTQWEQAMLRERLICGHWPAAYGGRDLTAAQSAIIDQECLRAGLPRIFRDQGEAWLGPAIMANGTEEQKDYYLPRIVSGEHSWCQGFSEPNHGSDLAALETKGVIEGDEIVITGQKIWTTYGGYANMLFILVRTDPDLSLRHKGISFVVVDKSTADPARLEFRPIRQLTGDDEFTETFVDGLRVPVANIIGGVDNGWKVAMTTLDNERAGRAHAARNAVFDTRFRALVRVADELGRSADPEVRREMLDVYTDLQALQFWSGDNGGHANESVEKLVGSLWAQKFGHLAMTVLGEQGAVRPEGVGRKDEGYDYRLNPWQFAYLQSLSGTIASGSSEIQRNIIAERVLGMPREARG